MLAVEPTTVQPVNDEDVPVEAVRGAIRYRPVRVP